MAIYTRTGDSGSTSLFTGQRVSKTHLRVETYGTLDELNATLSLCYCATAIESHRILLEAIQQQIFWFSAELASESEQPSAQQRYIGTEEIAALENAIDSAMNAVPPVHSFILPGRCEAASRMHFARTVARRAERRLVELTTETTVRNVLLHYINRLSDCLYALARVEDNVAHQNLMIQEITKRYHEANHTPALKERTMPLTSKRYARLAKTCHLCPDNANDTASLNALIQHIEQLNTTCTLPTLANALKEKKAEWSIRIPDMVQAALADATLRTNPRAADASAIAELLKGLL